MNTSQHQLRNLQRRYSSAPYSFFAIRNYDDMRDAFLRGAIDEPNFTSSKLLNEHYLQRRKQELEKAVANDPGDNPELDVFLKRRIPETELLLALVRLRDDPAGKVYLKRYRTLMKQMHGDFDATMFAGVINYLHDRAAATNQQAQFSAIRSLLRKHQDGQLYKPAPKLFSHYRKALMDSHHLFGALLRQELLPDLTREAMLAYFEWALEMSGAKAAGWALKESNHGANIMISQHRKQVVIGKHYMPYTKRRLRQVVAHEIMVHVSRTVAGSTVRRDDEEGIAIVVEQLLSTNFIYRRMLRYLAAALAWGADGKPRTFRETYDIVWRAFMIVGNHSERNAKERAFAECARVFRGGVPGAAGAAYIKDKVYLETNLTIWKYLEDNELSHDAFLAVIDGKEQL